MAQQNLVTKISVKTVCGKVDRKKLMALEGKDMPLMRVFGVAHDMKDGTGDNGPWIAFIGQFKAINLETGEETRAEKLFLPTAATDLIASQLKREGVQTVEFAFDLLAREDESSSTGYVYKVSSLIEAQEDDPLSKMQASLSKFELPKLAAPVATPAAEPGDAGKGNAQETGKKTK